VDKIKASAVKMPFHRTWTDPHQLLACAESGLPSSNVISGRYQAHEEN
jgi:hypothetical protein